MQGGRARKLSTAAELASAGAGTQTRIRPTSKAVTFAPTSRCFLAGPETTGIETAQSLRPRGSASRSRDT